MISLRESETKKKKKLTDYKNKKREMKKMK